MTSALRNERTECTNCSEQSGTSSTENHCDVCRLKLTEGKDGTTVFERGMYNDSSLTERLAKRRNRDLADTEGDPVSRGVLGWLEGSKVVSVGIADRFGVNVGDSDSSLVRLGTND